MIDYANRREGYASAIGTFSHPGHLGLFSSLCMIFFFFMLPDEVSEE